MYLLIFSFFFTILSCKKDRVVSVEVKGPKVEVVEEEVEELEEDSIDDCEEARCLVCIKKQEMAFNAVKEGDLSVLNSAFDIGVYEDEKSVTNEINREIVNSLYSMPNGFKRTLLHYAIQYNNIPLITRLLEVGADPNVSDDLGNTALIFSASIPGDFIDSFKLLAPISDLYAQNFEGTTALISASATGNIKIVQHLLDDYSDFFVIEDIEEYTRDNRGRSAIFYALQNGYEAIAYRLVESDSSILNHVDDELGSPIHYAFKHNCSSDMILFLIASMDSVNIIDLMGSTLLNYSLIYDRMDIFHTLLSRDDIDIGERAIFGITTLMIAAHRGNVDAVRALLIKRAIMYGAYSSDDEGNSALMHSVIGLSENRSSQDHFLCFEALIDKFSINARNREGNSILSIAVANNLTVIIDYIIGIPSLEVNEINREGLTPLMIALSSNNLDIVRKLLKRGDIDLNLGSESGLTPIVIAISSSVDAAKMLLSDPRLEQNNKLLPLAIEKGSVEMIKLIKVGLNDRNEEGDTPLLLAISSGKLDVIEELLSYDDIDVEASDKSGVNALMRAILLSERVVSSERKRYNSIVKLLISKCSINLQDLSLNSALIYAASYGYIYAVDEMQSLGDKLEYNLQNSDGNTALMVAVERGYEDIAKLLLPFTDLNLKNRDRADVLKLASIYNRREIYDILVDNTPLMIAARDGDIVAVKALKGKGSNEKNRYGETPLMLAASNGQLDVVEELLSYDDIDVEAIDEEGVNALMKAILFGGRVVDRDKGERYDRIVDLLISRCRDINIQDLSLNTLLMRAASSGYIYAIEAIQNMGDELKYNLQNRIGNTALMIAVEKGHEDVAKLLLPFTDIFLENKHRSDVLELASLYNRQDILELLMSEES